jgi:protein CpxP
MKKLLLVCCLLMGLTIAANAQSTQSVEKAKGLQKQLKLTDKQTGKIATIYQESSEKFEKIKKAEHGDNAKILTAIKPLRTATIQKIKAVLTPQQKVKYDTILKGSNGTGGMGWGEGWSAPASE